MAMSETLVKRYAHNVLWSQTGNYNLTSRDKEIKDWKSDITLMNKVMGPGQHNNEARYAV